MRKFHEFAGFLMVAALLCAVVPLSAQEARGVPHPISWTVFLIIIMQQPQGQAASDGPAAGIET